MMLVGIRYRFSSHSRHFLTMGCSHYPLLHFPPPLRCRSRFGRGRDVYEFKSKVVEKKNGVEESEKDISIVVGALSDNPIHGFKFDNDNSPNIRTSLAAQIPIDPALGDPALVSHTTLSEIGDVSASHASFGHAIADLVGALDTGIGSRHRFVITAVGRFLFHGTVRARICQWQDCIMTTIIIGGDLILLALCWWALDVRFVMTVVGRLLFNGIDRARIRLRQA